MIPRHIVALMSGYFVASLAHFAHNAEFIAFYPNLPFWLTRENICLAWLAVCAVGAAGLVVLRSGHRALGVLFIAAYGALGFAGLAHYSLALCSEHTIAANITIWAEVVTGLFLVIAASVLTVRGFRPSINDT